jgi:DeoR/GlpR family transcriptional regulator of sugar metabolism
MITQWVGGRLLADRECLAQLLGVSERTIRRRCRPVDYEPQTGRPRGVGGRALYDAQTAAETLTDSETNQTKGDF